MKMDASDHARTRRPWVLLACALALILGVSAGCGSSRVRATVQASKTEAVTGEDVPLSVDGMRITDQGGCGHEETRSAFAYPTPVDRYWTVTPAGGARVRNGVFRATRPGTYSVTFGDLNTREVQAASIVVTGEEAATETSETNAPVNPLVGTWTWETRYALQHWTKKGGVEIDKWDWKAYPGQPKYAFEIRGTEIWVKVTGTGGGGYDPAKVDFDGTHVAFTMNRMAGTNDEATMVCTGVLGIDRIEGTVEFTMKVPPPLTVPPWPRRQQWVATRVGD